MDCQASNVTRNPQGGEDIESFCTRTYGHDRGRGESPLMHHHDEDTGLWWDRYGYDRTDEHK